MTPWDETYDLVIVGSGGGAMCAALTAKDRGLNPLIIEKMDTLGGSTALSGGVLWIPNNPLMKRADRDDSYEKARTYIENMFDGYQSRGASPERVDHFLKGAPAMIGFLESKGMEFHLCKFWPDYYDHLPGGERVSRSIMATPFNIKELGEWESRLNFYLPFDMPLHPDLVHDIGLMRRTWSGKIAVLRLALSILREKLTGTRRRSFGFGLQGRMLQLVLRNQVPIWLGAPVRDLVFEEGRVAGVVVERNGQQLRVKGTKGVLVASGGFARNAEMRNKYQRQPITANWTNANIGNTGEMLETIIGYGAATENLDLSIWTATSGMPNGDASPGTVINGKVYPHMHSSSETGKPHCIAVDKRGLRFVDESGSYMAFGEAMYENAEFPWWYILDQEHRNRYAWGSKFGVPKNWLTSGYMKKADTIEDLARQCGIDPEGLKNTVERFNEFARTGKDLDFGRGENCYARWTGDETNKPNPGLGTIAKKPFYAVAAFPGCVGTAGGLVCDEFARVLREDSSIIDGLYATGNCTSSPLGRFYPGAGGSVGSSFTFGYIAALHAAGETGL